MKTLVLLRHGESEWNKENRFTGWTDVDLSEKGHEEAKQAGRLLRMRGIAFDRAYTSYLKRAIHTLNHALDELDEDYIPVEKSWELNERHYGALQGLNKADTAKKYGDEQVLIWRRSFDVLPPALDPADPRAPKNQAMYAGIDPDELPLTESLKTTIERVVPYFEENIKPRLEAGETILVAAHGNSLRALVKYLDHIDDEKIVSLNIPTGVPLVYEFDDEMNVLDRYYLGDQDVIKAKMEAVARQGTADAKDKAEAEEEKAAE